MVKILYSDGTVERSSSASSLFQNENDNIMSLPYEYSILMTC